MYVAYVKISINFKLITHLVILTVVKIAQRDHHFLCSLFVQYLIVWQPGMQLDFVGVNVIYTINRKKENSIWNPVSKEVACWNIQSREHFIFLSQFSGKNVNHFLNVTFLFI